MVMKASLQLKLGQSLTMTPQLQQAIRLLQLSTLDLQQEIQQALDSNPMLETAEDDDHGPDDTTEQQSSDDQHNETASAQDDNAPESSNDWDESENGPDWNSENDITDTIPDDLPVDTAWEDIYQTAPASTPKDDDENDSDFETRNSPTGSPGMAAEPHPPERTGPGHRARPDGRRGRPGLSHLAAGRNPRRPA